MYEKKSYYISIKDENGNSLTGDTGIEVIVRINKKRAYCNEEEKMISIYNKCASKLLEENERLFKKFEQGKDLISEDHPFDRLCFPKGYVGKLDTYRKLYKTKEIFNNKPKDDVNLRQFEDRLQMMSLFDYLIRRMNTFGRIRELLYLYATINIITIIEAMIQESAFNCLEYCKKCNNGNICPNNEACKWYLSKAKDVKSTRTLINAMSEKDVLNLQEKDDDKDPFYINLDELYKKRNEIHIRIEEGEKAERKSDRVNDEKIDDAKYWYELAKAYLGDTAYYINERMVPYYNECPGYEKYNKKGTK